MCIHIYKIMCAHAYIQNYMHIYKNVNSSKSFKTAP